MIANYHTHTARCGHAEGTEREYIERAIQGGFQILGFSDHTPYFFEGTNFVSPIRMRPEQLPEYAETILGLKQEYRDRIELHLGVEAEFYPRFFPRLVQELKDHGVEYMILGQHHLENEMGAFYNGHRTTDPALLDRYVGQCMEAMDTGLFTYFAHPDLIHFIGEPREFERQARKLCTAAREHGLPMEINLLGLREGRHYPGTFFWRIVGEEGVPVILGSDAHRPQDTWSPQTEQHALEWVERFGLNLLETTPLKTI